jgi:hypothetical protein
MREILRINPIRTNYGINETGAGQPYPIRSVRTISNPQTLCFHLLSEERGDEMWKKRQDEARRCSHGYLRESLRSFGKKTGQPARTHVPVGRPVPICITVRADAHLISNIFLLDLKSPASML